MAVGPYAEAIRRFPTVRQSRLATFDRCALSSSFEEEYRHDWTSHPAARGKIMHEVFAEALRIMAEQGEATIPTDAIIEILEDKLRQADVDARDFTNIPFAEIKDMRWVAVKWAHDSAFDIENLVDVEQRLSATIRYPDPAGGWVERIVTGQLDAWFIAGENDDEAVVLDWKDTWALPGPAELDFDGYFQQRIYAFLLFSQPEYRGIEKLTLRERYVRYSEDREAVVWRSDIEDVERELSALVERFDRAYATGTFPPAPGKHCQICPRPTACPIFPGVRPSGAIMDRETAEKYAAEAVVAKKAYETRVAELKAWTSVHGPTPVSDHKGKRVWGHRPVTRTARPDRKALERALREGTLDLDRLYETKQGTRFEMHQPVEEEEEPHPADAQLERALQRSIEQQKKDTSE